MPLPLPVGTPWRNTPAWISHTAGSYAARRWWATVFLRESAGTDWWAYDKYAVCREPIEESDNWLEFWRDERDSLGYFDTAGEVDTFRNLSDGDEYVYYLPGTISESAGLGGADITQKSLQEAINEALSTLTPREEKVLRLRFGLDDGRIRTLEEVGEELNTTRERIRHIEAKALQKLRHPFCSAQLRDLL